MAGLKFLRLLSMTGAAGVRRNHHGNSLAEVLVPGELLILGDFSHFAIMAVVSAGRSSSVDSVVAESVLGEYPIYPATASFEADDIKPIGGIKQPPVCDTCLGSEIAIDKTEGLRPAVGCRPVVARPARHACDAG